MNLNPQTITNLIMVAAAWGVAFLIALWLSLVTWTYRDIRARARDPFVRFLATIIVALLFVPGVIVYLIMRPSRTLEDEYQHSLEEEALLRSIEEADVCPGCGRRIRENWIICPGCHTKLKKSCHNCSKLMDLSWNLCPYCGTPAPGMRKEKQTMDEVTRPVPFAGDEEPDDLDLAIDFIEEDTLKNKGAL